METKGMETKGRIIGMLVLVFLLAFMGNVSSESTTCSVCEGGTPTGQYDDNGCMIYACPGTTCSVCEGGTPTGQYDDNGCMIYECPVTSCPEECICTGETMTCPIGNEERPTFIDITESGSGTVSIKSESVEVETNEKIRVVNSKLYVETSAGNKEIKIMPETASEKAIETLGELNFTIELKEVGKGEEVKVVYEAKAKKQGRFLGLFKIKGEVVVDIDSETGEVISTKKPWWSFLASDI